ncbi:MAG: zinc transporter ZupT [Victivallales bacterium]|nr:zinc transporter ZupT [Victivallales bacterium]
MLDLTNFWIAVLLTSVAGLATGIGSILALFTKRTNTSFLSLSLGFSAGVMIYISFVELLSKAREILLRETGMGKWLCALMFFLGFGIVAFIDKLVPNYENPHEMHRIEELRDKKEAVRFNKLYRIGMMMAIIISLHNFPEGLVTFLGTLASIKFGAIIAFAIAIHNIPEGIAVAIPIYYGTGSRKKALIYSFLSGFAEPLGGILGYLILKPFINGIMLGSIFAVISGIMVFISFDSLLPAAEEYGKHHLAILGLVIGMMAMSASLLLL